MDFSWLIRIAAFIADQSVLLWRDMLEVSMLAMAFYGIIRWLRKDRQKNLVGYFYAYWLLAVGAHMMQLYTISLVLIGGAPIIALLFIVLHQEQLQRNFITMRSLVLQEPSSATDWPNQLVRAFLYRMNNKSAARCIIQQRDVLELEAPYVIDAHVSCDLIKIILDADTADTPSMLWIKQGRLHAPQATHTWTVKPEWFDAQTQTLEAWKQDALLLTSKTDAMVLGVDPVMRTFCLIAQGKVVEHSNVQTIVRLLNNYVRAYDSRTSTKEAADHAHEKISSKQLES